MPWIRSCTMWRCPCHFMFMCSLGCDGEPCVILSEVCRCSCAQSYGDSQRHQTGQHLADGARVDHLPGGFWLGHPGDWHCDVVGSITNLAPEALPSRAGESASSNPFRGQPVDVWAAGATLCELGTGLAPFRAPTFPAMFAKIRQGRELVNLFAPSGLSTFPALWFMLAADPALRCSAEHACCQNCKVDWKFHFPPRKRQRRE